MSRKRTASISHATDRKSESDEELYEYIDPGVYYAPQVANNNSECVYLNTQPNWEEDENIWNNRATYVVDPFGNVFYASDVQNSLQLFSEVATEITTYQYTPHPEVFEHEDPVSPCKRERLESDLYIAEQADQCEQMDPIHLPNFINNELPKNTEFKKDSEFAKDTQNDDKTDIDDPTTTGEMEKTDNSNEMKNTNVKAGKGLRHKKVSNEKSNNQKYEKSEKRKRSSHTTSAGTSAPRNIKKKKPINITQSRVYRAAEGYLVEEPEDEADEKL